MTTTHIPQEYREIGHIDLQKDKKLALLVNLLAAGMMVLLFVLGTVLVPPFAQLLPLLDDSLRFLLYMALLLVGLVVYIVLHELVHGVFMRAFSGVKPTYGFTLLYAYAGSTAYFSKRHYIIIALSPVVIWGLVLLLLNLLLPVSWFWPVYFIQVMNLSGAAGDLYVTWKMLLRLPADVLTQDTGVSMTFFAPEE